MTLFIGDNLRNIRTLHGYTRKQLAEKLQITEQAVWQYENGYTSPKMQMVNKLKGIFHVQSQYFTVNDILTNYDLQTVDLNHIAYRSKTINSIQKTQTESKHMQFIDAFLKEIEDDIVYPLNQLEFLREQVIKMFESTGTKRMDMIEEAACYVRDFLNLDELGNKNLLFSLEKSGAFIFEKSIGEDVDAYSLWTDDGRPYIMLGNLKKSAVRRNFDLAHELGHLLLHYKVEFVTSDSRSYREYEQEANVFASSLLLPKKDFTQDIQVLPKKSHPDSYIDLKKKWSVSIQAMAYRANQLKLITYQQYRYFNMQLHRLDYKITEPLDHEIVISRPGKIRSILQLLFERNIISLPKLLDKLKIDIQFLVNLLGISPSFFDEYNTRIAKSFSIAELKTKYN